MSLKKSTLHFVFKFAHNIIIKYKNLFTFENTIMIKLMLE